MLTSLEEAVAALQLRSAGNDLFTAGSERGRFAQVFGGQLVAQALLAAAATAEGKQPQSLHATFVEAGDSARPLDVAVERVRDGRSMATRQISIRQGGRTVLAALASFRSGGTGPELSDPPPQVPPPGELPLLQDWIRELPPEVQVRPEPWIEHPPPIEIRTAQPPSFLGGPAGRGTRSHWMRLPAGVGDDPLLHAALLAYASDYFLLDMALRAHPERTTPLSMRGFSLDHALWLHRPVRFDRWHLHTQRLLALTGERGLVSGALHDEDGHLVATAMQEVLVRPAP